MALLAAAVSTKHLIFPWRRVRKPWELTFWTIVWNLLTWTTLYFFSEAKITFDGKLITSFAELLFIHPIYACLLGLPPVGICLAYHALGRWLNQTHLIRENGKVMVLKRPLPWPHSFRTWHEYEFQKIWPESYSPGYENGLPIERLRLKALLSNGLEIILVDNLLMEELSLIEPWIAIETSPDKVSTIKYAA